jgi:hypothetical protein
MPSPWVIRAQMAQRNGERYAATSTLRITRDEISQIVDGILVIASVTRMPFQPLRDRFIEVIDARVTRGVSNRGERNAFLREFDRR